MVVTFIFLLLCVIVITLSYRTDMFGKKNELDYFLASQKLLGMLPFVQLSTCIIQLGGLCLGSSLVILFYDSIAYAMESDSEDANIKSDSAVVKLELDNVRKGHTSTLKNALDDEVEKLGEFQSSGKRQKGMVPDSTNNESRDCHTPPRRLRKPCFLDFIDMNYSYTTEEEFLERNGFHNGIKIVEGEEYCIDFKVTGPTAPLRWKNGEPPPCNDGIYHPAYTWIPGYPSLSFCITKKSSIE